MSFPTIDEIYAQGENYGAWGLAYIDPYLYVLYWNGKIHKINPETYAKIDEWIAPSEACRAKDMCTDCEYLYIVTGHCPSPYNRIHVYKIDPETMATVTSWTGQHWGNQQASGESIKFDFQSERLLVLEEGTRNNVGSNSRYRVYKLTQNLAKEMHVDADDGYSQYHGYYLTVMDSHFFVTTGGTPGAIDKRLISDFSFEARFEGSTEDPDDYIEGIFFNICNDGEYLYTATYDYAEERPTRLIKVDPSDMFRVATFYGAGDEVLALGSYAYGGRIYMLLIGWDGGENYGEAVIQIDPATMSRTAGHMNWNVDENSAHKAVGDGSRMHIGFSRAARSVLQFADEGAPECIPWVGKKVILSSSKDKYFVEKIRTTGIGDTGMLVNASSQKCFLPKVSIKAGDTCKITSFKDRYFARKF